MHYRLTKRKQMKQNLEAKTKLSFPIMDGGR